MPAYEAILRLVIGADNKDEAQADLNSVEECGTFDREHFGLYVHPLRELSEDEYNRFVDQRNPVWYTDRAVEPFATLAEATAYINNNQPDEEGTRINLQQLDDGRWRVDYLLDMPGDPDFEYDVEGELRQLARAVAELPASVHNASALAQAVMRFTAEQPDIDERDPEEPVAHLAVAMDDLMKSMNGQYAVEDMLHTASCALLRAGDAARRQRDDETGIQISALFDQVNNLLAS